MIYSRVLSAADEAEYVLADSLRALGACVRHIEALGSGMDWLLEAKAVLEEAEGFTAKA